MRTEGFATGRVGRTNPGGAGKGKGKGRKDEEGGGGIGEVMSNNMIFGVPDRAQVAHKRISQTLVNTPQNDVSLYIEALLSKD